jgi:hypothetical protein|nr:MAG TPA: hypothetical protein [Caudoviricetes sp.]
MTNQNGYLSSKIKQIEQKVIQIKAENALYLEEIEGNNRQTAQCLSSIRKNNELLNALSYNLTVVGEMARNVEQSLIILPEPNKGKILNKIA